MVWLVAAGAVGGLLYLDPAKRKPTSEAVVHPPPVVRVEPPVEVRSTPDAAVEAEVIDAATIVDASEPQAPPLYTVTEALDDLASGPLTFFGTGEWFGNFSIHGCAYRNARVIVVNVYCTVKEQTALGLVVLSPTRGRVMVYAEAEKPISTLRRADYLQFRVEAQPAISDDPLALDVTYAQLRAWDERRYHNVHVGACWAGDTDGCASEIKSSLDAWLPAEKTFLATPPDSFYKVVKDLHTRAVRDSQRTK